MLTGQAAVQGWGWLRAAGFHPWAQLHLLQQELIPGGNHSHTQGLALLQGIPALPR